MWQTAAVFGIGSAAGLGFVLPLAGRVPPLHHARLAMMIVTAFVINASLLWWRFVRRWRSLQTLKYQRMHELEAELGFRQHRLVHEADERVGLAMLFAVLLVMGEVVLYYWFWQER
jgi:hypothetical protein